MASTLLALGLGIFLAVRFSDALSEYAVSEFELSTEFLPILSFAAIFIVVVIGVHFIGKALEKVVNMAAMKLLNKLSGLLFGVLRTALILSVLLTVITAFDAHAPVLPEKWKKESLLYKPLSRFAGKIVPAVKNSNWVEPWFNKSKEAA